MLNLSPFNHKLNVVYSKIMAKIFPSRIVYEVLVCHKNKLPEKVMVSWQREKNGFIIGKVTADDYNFVAQGKNAKEFIEGVNDAIFAICEIPVEYMEELGGYKHFFPTEEELERLKDKSISSYSFGISNDKKLVPSNG